MIDSIQTLLDTIAEGESNTTEFKTSFQKEVIETVVAFANAKGGNILIGVKDSGEIIGVAIDDESMQNHINTIKQNTEPSIIVDIEPYEIDAKTILNIEVTEYPVKPVAYKGRYFKRRSNSNHQMTPTEISDAHMKTLSSSWDYFADPYHDINDIDEQNVKKFITMAHLDDDIATVYSKFDLLKDAKITIGAYLLFNNNDRALLTGIEIGRFQTETIIKDSLSIHGGLINQVDAVIAFIYKHINKAYVITGKPQRDEIWDYPMDAIREIVVNMIVHRDYRSSGHTTVKIFDDRIEFFNQGKLPEELSIEKIKTGKYRSMPRNLQIADVFKAANIIERYGSGIKRVIATFRAYGLKEPTFEATQGGMLVTAYKEKVNAPVNASVNAPVNAIQRHILEVLQNHPDFSYDALAQSLNKNRTTIMRNIKILKEQGLLQRIGSDKSGYWEVIND